MESIISIIFILFCAYMGSKKKRKEGKESIFADKVDEVITKIKEQSEKEMAELRESNSAIHDDEKIYGKKIAAERKAETKARLERKYAGERKKNKSTTNHAAAINERARQNIKSQDLNQTKQRVEEESHELTMDEIIRRKEEELRFGNESHHQEIPEEAHLMEIVEDLMVKGPDTSLPNERDFLAESMQMLENIV